MRSIKTNASESSKPRKVTTQRRRQKPFKQRKIPKMLIGIPVCIYAAPVYDFVNSDVTIQPLVVSESASSSLHDTTPQDTLAANLASSESSPANQLLAISESAPSSLHDTTPQDTASPASSSPANQLLVVSKLAPSSLHDTTSQDTANLVSSPAEFFCAQSPASTQCLSSHIMPISYQYDIDFNTRGEDTSLLTNNPCPGRSCQCAAQYYPYQQCVNPRPILSHVSNTSLSSTDSFSMEHGVDSVEPYQQCLDPNNQYIDAQAILLHVSNVSSSSTGSFDIERDVESYQQLRDPNKQYINPQPLPSHVSNTLSSSTGSFSMDHDVEPPYQQWADANNQSFNLQPILSYVSNASSSSAGSFSMEHDVEPYRQWLDTNNHYINLQPILSYVSNASSTFLGNSDNIYAEFSSIL